MVMKVSLSDLLERASARKTPLPVPTQRRAIREAAGVTQEDLSAVLGVTRASLSRYETGSREPRGEIRQLYAEALEALRRV
jgi:DNA-binding transcriptional regulator YiaG